MNLTAIALKCSLKRSSGEPSSADAMIRLLGTEFGKHEVSLTETIRVADYNILPGFHRTREKPPGLSCGRASSPPTC